MDVTALSAQSVTLSRANKSANALADNFDTFLKLLTTQLQHQDPLDPMDSNEFTRQLVEFSGVEQAIHTNKNLESLIALISANAASGAVSYLGREATASTATTRLQDANATWSFTLPKEPAATIATITNSAGRVVYVGQIAGAAGRNTFAWDGNDNRGNLLPEGEYTITITARDSEGKSIAPTVSISGLVSAVEFENGLPILTVGGARVPLSLVTSVRTPSV